MEKIIQIAKIMSKKNNRNEVCNAEVWFDAMEYTAYFLTSIVNESLAKGEIPDEWKISTITPIQKIRNSRNASDFRPINSMLTDEKIAEYVVKEQLVEYIESNNILTIHQSAFRKNHSCETTLNYVVSELKEYIDKDQVAIVVFLDLKRAFETIDRERMIRKLQNCGIDGIELKWFESYLTNRKQYTKYKNESSETLEIPIGLPQGTQLSVFLFLIYINDIVNLAENGKIVLFADDTVLMVVDDSIDSAKRKTNECLKRILDYTIENKLMLNAEKSKWMLMGKNDETQIEIEIGNKKLEGVGKIKYLGAIIDSEMKFEAHVENIRKKTASKIGYLKRISKKLTFHTKKIISNAIVMPHFNYCSTLLITCKKEQIESLQKLQNKLMRIILKCDYLTPIEYMLKELNWLSISQKIIYNVILMIFQMKNNLLPKYLCNKLIYANEIHERNTRNKDEMRLPKYKKEATRRNIFYKGIQMYNQISKDMKQEKNINIFKKKLHDYVKQNIIKI